LKFFVDESLQLPGGFQRKPFYLMAYVGVTSEALLGVKANLDAISGGYPTHATELLRSSDGRQLLLEVGAKLAPLTTCVVFQTPLDMRDKAGEQGRRSLIMGSLGFIFERFSDLEQVVFESRAPGYQKQTDLRTLQAFRSKEIWNQRPVDIRPVPKNREPLLELADLLASAYRQKITRSENRYWETWSASTTHVYI
jgi:hypothetical protein